MDQSFRRALGELVPLAASGDRPAWDEIVDRFSGLVWNVARGYRLNAADAADVSQTVWLRLVEHLGRLREPEALPGWLATTARHETLRLLRRSGREIPDDDAVGTGLDDRPSGDPGPESLVLQEEQNALVWRALATLSLRCQILLRALSSVQEHSYAEISAALGMPIGSIGPTRARCFDNLRTALAGLGLATAGD